MKHLTLALGAAALLCAAVFAQGGQGTLVDSLDIPTQQQLCNYDSVRKMIDMPMNIDPKWQEAENHFMTYLNAQERTDYDLIRENCERLRLRMMAFRDSVKNMTKEQRQTAIQERRAQIQTMVVNLLGQIDSRLTLEQKQVREERRAEIAKKRAEIKRHLDALRQRIQQRLMEQGVQ